MTDILDQASKLEEQNLAQSLKSHEQRREQPHIIRGVRVCLGCEMPVPAKRIHAVNAVRCLDCQQYHEIKAQHYRR